MSQVTNKEAAMAVTKARVALLLDFPFFGSLALRLAIVEDTECPTAWTDGVKMGYNPDFILSLSADQIKGLVAHEVMHCVCSHMTRRQDREMRKWNIACDYVINGIIAQSGLCLPDGTLLDAQFNGQHSEHVYAVLPDSPDGPGKGKQGIGGGHPGNGSSDPGGCGEVRDYPGAKDGEKPSPADISQHEQDWKIATTQAAQVARREGKLPAVLGDMLIDLLEPKVDWREYLIQFALKASKNDYSWARPNKRFVGQDIYMPSLHSLDLGTIGAFLDSSGSVSNRDYGQFGGEMTGILEQFPESKLIALHFDTEVGKVEEFEFSDLPLQLHRFRCGGTDFIPPAAYIEEHGIELSCAIYLTDGYCSSFPATPTYPVLWVLTEKHSFDPPFGEVVFIERG